MGCRQQWWEEGVEGSWECGVKEEGADDAVQYTVAHRRRALIMKAMSKRRWRADNSWERVAVWRGPEERESGGLSDGRKRGVSSMVLQWWRWLMQHGVTSALQQSRAEQWQANLSSVDWNEWQCCNYNMWGYSVAAARSTCSRMDSINHSISLWPYGNPI